MHRYPAVGWKKSVIFTKLFSGMPQGSVLHPLLIMLGAIKWF